MADVGMWLIGIDGDIVTWKVNVTTGTLMNTLHECMRTKRARVCVFPNGILYSVSFCKHRPVDLYENSTYCIHIKLVRVSLCFTDCFRSHVIDFCRFRKYAVFWWWSLELLMLTKNSKI